MNTPHLPAAYRNLEPALAMRLEALDAAPVDVVELRRVYEQRVARTVQGAVMTAIALALFATVAASLILDGRNLVFSGWGWQGLATLVLLGAWPLGLAAGVVARLLARFRSAQLARRRATTGHATVVLADLETMSPARVLARHAYAIERASMALPLVGMAMLAPLTLHFVVWAIVCAVTGATLSPSSFDQWIGTSVALVGHAHLVVACFAYRFARKAHTMPTEDLRRYGGAWGAALGLAALVACAPGALLIMVPPVLVTVTAVATIPAMFYGVRSRILRERESIAAAAV